MAVASHYLGDFTDYAYLLIMALLIVGACSFFVLILAAIESIGKGAERTTIKLLAFWGSYHRKIPPKSLNRLQLSGLSLHAAPLSSGCYAACPS